MAISAEDSSDCRRFSLDQLKAATDDFSESNLLGRGAYGLVHRGDLFGCQVREGGRDGG